MNFYVSKYTNIIELQDNTSLLFNSYNGCLDEVSRECSDKLREKKEISHNLFTVADFNYLQQRGHITHLNSAQECELFTKYVKKLDEFIIKQPVTTGSIMLLLSYACNLRCPYCYQKSARNEHDDGVMSSKLIDDIFNKYYFALFNNIPKNAISLTLYGGEPFLPNHREVIEKILFYSNKEAISVGAISNATTLDTMLDFFGPRPGQISFVQISLDGMRDYHNLTRIPVNKNATFDIILQNIHLLLRKKVRLNIRINVTKENIVSIPELMSLLQEEEILEHPLAYTYVHPIHNHFHQTDENWLFSLAELCSEIEKIAPQVRHPAKRKADGLRHFFDLQKGIGPNRTRFCMQSNLTDYLIDPRGDIYSCYEEAGREEFRTGTLTKNGVNFFSMRQKYLEKNLSNMPDCLACEIALICGGQCGVKNREENGDILKPDCISEKVVYLEALKYAYLERKQQKEDLERQTMVAFPNL